MPGLRIWLTGARNVPIFFSPFEKTKPIQGAVGRGFERLAGARDFSVSGAGVGIVNLLKVILQIKKPATEMTLWRT